MSEERSVPSKGDRVQIVNSESGDVVAKGEVIKVQRFTDGDDDAVYLELDEQSPDGSTNNGQVIEFKQGWWDGDSYSWTRRRTDTLGSHDLAEDTNEYEIIN